MKYVSVLGFTATVFVFTFLILPISNVDAEWWCGKRGSSLSGLIPDKPKVEGVRVDFRGSCMRHDVCYGMKGMKREDCDRNFFQDMKQKCSEYFIDGSTRFNKCNDIATKYYYTVQRLGKKAYRKAQARHKNR